MSLHVVECHLTGTNVVYITGRVTSTQKEKTMSNAAEFEDMFGDSEQVVKDTASTGLFIRLKDGDEVDVVFPKIKVFSYKTVWNTKTNRSEVYDEDAHSGERPSGRHRFVVARITDDGPAPAILEVSNDLFETIKNLLKKKGFGRSYTIARTGTGMNDTKYTVVNNDALEDEKLEFISKLEYPDHTKLEADEDEKPSTKKPAKKNPW